MLQRVAVLAIPNLSPFEFGVACEVFGIDRRDTGGPSFDFSVVTARPGLVPTKLGFGVHVDRDLSGATDADLLVVPASPPGATDEEYLGVVREAVDKGKRVLSICSGAFTLAKAGVLDGRRATTHWMYAERLAREFPSIQVDPDVLFVEDGGIVTSAGTAAGIDAALHIVRAELGAGVAANIARRMVIPPQREGGQAQYIAEPIPECADDSLAALIDWMLEHLDEDLTIEQLARRAFMSTRTFARRFKAVTGATPAAWLNRQRVLRAQRYLEESDMDIDRIAERCGFGTAAVMRHHFARTLGVSPRRYRQTFGARLAG